MTPYEIARLRYWFRIYIEELESVGSHIAAKVAQMAFDSFLNWMEN